jgi:predicted PurR-regulated permease PerM
LAVSGDRARDMLNIYPLLRGGDVHASSGRAPIELNPVLVILSLLFWDAIWGIPSALLAVPLLAIIKIFADRIEPLKSLGHLIGA